LHDHGMDKNIELMFCFSLLIVILIVRGLKFQRNIPLPHVCVNLINVCVPILNHHIELRSKSKHHLSHYKLMFDPGLNPKLKVTHVYVSSLYFVLKVSVAFRN
jgi:hypothetical protein